MMNNSALHTLPGPETITRVQFANGITLLTRSNFESPSVFVGGYLGCGSMFDPLDKLGLAHFTALSLMRGTERLRFQEIYETLESAGANLGFGASVHNVNFGGRALAEDLPLLLQRMSEALRQPVFPEDQIERLRAQILTSLAIRAHDTGDLADMTFDALMFPGHPYGRPEDGYPETIQSITREDLQQFHRACYRPDTLVMVVVGAVAAQQAIEQVEQYFGDWQPGFVPAAPIAAAISGVAQTVRRHVSVAGKFQTDLAMGVLGPKRHSVDFMAASLGNNILGQFGMMGRIGESVREKAGLAYHASTSLNASLEGGTWEAYAGVSPVNLQRAIDLILQEIQRFTASPVDPEELANSQANYTGRLPLSMESNAGVANALLNIERYQLGLDYYQRYAGLVRAVTPEIVLETARKYWHMDRMVIVSAGPEIEMKPDMP